MVRAIGKIQELLDDSGYIILPDGAIWTDIPSKGSGRGPWRELATTTDSDGYVRIKYRYSVLRLHRIVYAAYVGPLDDKLVINHIDGHKANNHYTNLEQVTQSRNLSVGSLHGPPSGYTKTTEAETQSIFDTYTKLKSIRRTAALFNRSYGTVQRISKMKL